MKVGQLHAVVLVVLSFSARPAGSFSEGQLEKHVAPDVPGQNRSCVLKIGGSGLVEEGIDVLLLLVRPELKARQRR